MRTCVIFNPTARGEKAQRFRRYIDSVGSECALKLTWASGTAGLLAKEAVGEGFECIVAAGGDGTVNEVLNGIASAPDGLKQSTLGVLPLGTVNVFAKEFNLPTRIDRAWKTIRAGKTQTIDLPSVLFQGANGPENRHFIQLAGAGLDARAVELVDWEWKKKVGPLAYILAGAKAMREKHPSIKVSTTTTIRDAEMVLIGNGRFYGGRFKVFPNAEVTDRHMDVCMMRRVTWFGLFRLGMALSLGRCPTSAGTELMQCTRLQLDCDSRVPLELEGDTVGKLAASFSMAPDSLRIIVP